MTASGKRCASVADVILTRCLMQDFWPRVYVAPSDFVALTHGGALCDDMDRLGATEFELAMREQLRLYTQVDVTLYYATVFPPHPTILSAARNTYTTPT